MNKLCTLLSRSELRDLDDVRVLPAGDGDLERALGAAAQKDTGFSAPTLAWVLRSLAVESLAEASGLAVEDAKGLSAFRDELVEKLADLAIVFLEQGNGAGGARPRL